MLKTCIQCIKSLCNYNTINSFKYFSTFPSNVYISANNKVRCDTLWRKYAQQTVSSAQFLKPSDAVLLFHSFAKIGFKDHRVIKALSLVILKNVHSLSPCGLSLVLSSLKKLETRNRDLLEIVTNQICLCIDNCLPRDVALVANSIAHFHVYHLTFWNKLRLYLESCINLSHLEASLILMAYAKLDIRDVSTIKLLLKVIVPEFENIEIKNSTLILHSLAKLDFVQKNFFDAAYSHIIKVLLNEPDKFDLQSLVLTLYTSACLVKSPKELIIKTMELIIPSKEILGNYKLGKLKMVVDSLMLLDKELYEEFDQDIKEFMIYIQNTPLKQVDKSSRWAKDVSKTLDFMKINHDINLHIQELYADIFFKDSNVVIKCAGPYNYYAYSKRMTAFARLNIKLLELKGYKVMVIPFFEWSQLRSLEEKVEKLYQLGRDASERSDSSKN